MDSLGDWVEEVPGGPVTILTAAVVGLGVAVLCYAIGCGAGKGSQTAGKANNGAESNSSQQQTKEQQNKLKGPKPFKQHQSRRTTLPSHPLLVTEFKGHTGAVLSLDFDSSGKYLGSCSDDRTIRLWYWKSLKEKEHRYTRKNIELDHASQIKFSPDGKAILATLAVANTIQVYRITKAQKSGTISLSDTSVEFPKLSSNNVLSLGIASTGKFIMTYSTKEFTVWSVKGEVLATVSTLQSPNTRAAVSPCGHFIACAGFTSDVKLWEVEFSKSGEYQRVSKAMDLMGHRASVLALSFSADSHRMATLSKDDTWKFWDIDVQYRLKEDPKLLKTGSVSSHEHSCIALSPDSRVVAISVDSSILLYSTASGDLAETLESVHRDVISDLCWDPLSWYLISAGGEDRHIRVWHNRPGTKQLLVDLEAKLHTPISEPVKRRVQEQIKEARDQLNSYEK